MKEPEKAASIMNRYVKHYIKVKSLSDTTAKKVFSPLDQLDQLACSKEWLDQSSLEP